MSCCVSLNMYIILFYEQIMCLFCSHFIACKVRSIKCILLRARHIQYSNTQFVSQWNISFVTLLSLTFATHVETSVFFFPPQF